ncbi:amino acid permease [Acidisoma silvae]|uniref:Amino acid permease n=1 Tax=Acidisoma silvae TaxID=2802396 RepID=A0A963YU21_9PROT|nr:amino acid permease [Acidisoma silvae]MCB8876699.1 amino acid permease [Acidisoma silvae]
MNASPSPSGPGRTDPPLDSDTHHLHKMGYAQELARRMPLFSNFAISFSIICILAGGITSFQLGFSSAGGFAIGVGWLIGAVFAIIVACSMAQIASAYPTAGGLYHWSSILGGRAWGWATAWINLLGLIFVIASVNVGVYLLFAQLVLTNIFGIDVSHWGLMQQATGVLLITATQALFNHFGIRVTTKLTDFSGYLILVTAVVLTVVMLYAAPSIDLGRLFSFTNNTGDAGGGVFPTHTSALMAVLLGLILPLYTITGFDASAHTSEETVNAQVTVPKGMIHAVIWSGLFGYIMCCSFVLAMPDVTKAAKDGGNVFFNLLAGLPVPVLLKDLIYIAIVVANYLCALAGMTSTSRMLFAFARDGGLPFSATLRKVNPHYRTPVASIWTVAALSFLATLYSPAFAALAAGCAVFLYISYAMPVAAGFLAEGKSWTEFGPFRLGGLSKLFAAITVVGAVILLYIGTRPPNDILDNYAIGAVVLLILGWFLLERKRFKGPPIGEAAIRARQAEIDLEEAAVDSAD